MTKPTYCPGMHRWRLGGGQWACHKAETGMVQTAFSLMPLFLFTFSLLFLFMYRGILPACMPGSCGDQKRVSDALELLLQTVVNPHVGVGN